MPNPIVVKVGPLAAASANNIALSQSLTAAGLLTIAGAAASGGVATLDVQRKVIITSAGNDSGITFIVSGANNDGNAFSETVTGGNAVAVATTQDFKSVMSVRGSGATASTVTVGTNGVASSKWFPNDIARNPTNIGFFFRVSGTVNYTLELTQDDPNNIINANPVQVTDRYVPQNTGYNNPPQSFNDNTVAGEIASQSYHMTFTCFAWRLTVNSGATGADFVQAEAVQAGMVGA